MAIARALIVDDDLFAEYFRARGYDVEVAESLMGAIGAVAADRPDVVLLDLGLLPADRRNTIVKA